MTGRLLVYVPLVALLADLAASAPLVQRTEDHESVVRVLVRPSPEDVARALQGGPVESGFLVLVPPGGSVAVRVEAQQLEAGPVTFPPEHWAGLPSEVARSAELGNVSRWTVQRVALASLLQGESPGRAAIVQWAALELTMEGPRQRGARDRSGRSSGLKVTNLPSADPAGAAVASVVVNPERLDAWRRERSVTASEATATGPVGCDDCLRIVVDRDGVYQVDYGDLSNLAGYDVRAYDPRQWKLMNRAGEVAMSVEGEADGTFDPGDRLLFVAKGNRERFSAKEVYWLMAAGSPGARFEAREAFPVEASGYRQTAVVRGQIRLEEQRLHHWKLLNPVGRDPWMTAVVTSVGTEASVEIPVGGTFDVPDLSFELDPSQTYQLRARIAGETLGSSSDVQSLRYELNGNELARDSWSFSATPNRDLVVSYNPTGLRTQDNRLRVVQPAPPLPAILRRSWIDWVELEYPRRLNMSAGKLSFTAEAAAGRTFYVSGSGRDRGLRIFVLGGGVALELAGPRWLSLGPGLPETVVFALRTPSSEVVMVEEAALLRPRAIELDTSSNLHGDLGSAYVVLAHPRLQVEAESLAARHGGLAISVQDVYDEFNWGIEDSQAVADFVRHAYAEWPTAVEHLVLLGDGSFDYRNHLQLAAADYDPPSLMHSREVYLQSTGNYRAGSDAVYAMVDGQDFLPDIAIARIPARTATQARDYLNKVLAYGSEPGGAWQRQVQLFADDDLSLSRTECGVRGRFGDDLESIVGNWADPLSPYLRRRYAGDYTMAFPHVVLQNDVVSDLRAGVGLQILSSHGNVVSVGRHCASDTFPIYDLDVVGFYSAGGRLPLGVAMTCDAGQFDFAALFEGTPKVESLAERYLLTEGAGNIAWLASTTVLQYDTGRRLTEALLRALYSGQPGPPGDRIVGTIAMAVAISHFADVGLAAREPIETMVVLGDPALTLRLQAP